MARMPNRVHEADLTVPVLIALRGAKDGRMATADLIQAMRRAMPLSAEDLVLLDDRNDERFTQIVRNIKSHKDRTENLIHKGFVTAVYRGFQITADGNQFLADNGH